MARPVRTFSTAQPTTRLAYEEYLNEIGTPEDDKRTNRGRNPSSSGYGTWLRVNDPIAFNVGYNDWLRDQK